MTVQHNHVCTLQRDYGLYILGVVYGNKVTKNKMNIRIFKGINVNIMSLIIT